MSTKIVTLRVLSLSSDKLGYFGQTSTNEFRKREFSEPKQAGKPSLHLKNNFVTAHGAAVASLPKFNESLPGLKAPGFFIDSTRPTFLSSKNGGRTPVENDPGDFHDNDSGVDIFALFNACDGAMRDDGFLDVTELEKYSPADAEALNVRGLKEIWKHTRTGCRQCREIVEALHELRGAIREVDIAQDDPELDEDHIKSI